MRTNARWWVELDELIGRMASIVLIIRDSGSALGKASVPFGRRWPLVEGLRRIYELNRRQAYLMRRMEWYSFSSTTCARRDSVDQDNTIVYIREGHLD